MLQNFGHVFDRNNRQPHFHIVRNFRQILFVINRDQHSLDATTQCSQQFFLQTTDRHRIAAQRHLARHSDILAHRNARQDRHNRRDHRQTGTWAVLWGRAIRHVYVDINHVKLGGLHANRRRN